MKQADSKTLKRFMDRLIRWLEKFLSRHRILAQLYFVFFKKMTLDEFAMIQLPAGASVVHIGCGSFPHTSMLLAQTRGWNITGIDRDRHAVEHAQHIINDHRLSDTIRIVVGDGKDFDVSSFDFIIVSHGIEPKKEVLEHLSNQMKKDACILFRTTWDRLHGLYGTEQIPNSLEIKASYDRIDGITSYLLIGRN
ncbi:MAG: class I SAM-dependent methyltransferase [Candidatus Nanoarchaeia archaeon]